MADKLHEYQGLAGRAHVVRDRCRERWTRWKEEHPRGMREVLKETFFGIPSSDDRSERVWQDSEYSDLFRRKSRIELVRISAAVMGIEFSYAGETAFVSPTLLQIGVRHQHMTLVWALSPLIGFFLTPILGSMSDRCKSRFGRRRPFIVMMSLGVLLGLVLVPNGEAIGYALGDTKDENRTEVLSALGPRSAVLESSESTGNHHAWGVFFTVLGTVFLDFDADACQSPARAYLLDVTIPEDHAKGLSTFTVMAGLGGFMGYALGGINWDETTLDYARISGEIFGGHVRAVFALITIIFLACVTATITSFKEIPLDQLQEQEKYRKLAEDERAQSSSDVEDPASAEKNNIKKDSTAYGSLSQSEGNVQEPEVVAGEPLSLKHYLSSIVAMPNSLRIVCLTNLFCWMAHVCYSLYFTDFVGRLSSKAARLLTYCGPMIHMLRTPKGSVDPTLKHPGIERAISGSGDCLNGHSAPAGSASRVRYEAGVRFGCWGMAMYSLSCACYSLVIEKFIKRFG
ncbi:Membrane-associated transporter protein [Eumeta japonica]|uniref:Membrane-associated transporter protein n=1 Tax=Eumeta variegata TaxID=151549 RepID=A0A4C1T5U1_EUMVA|nr:Membrane-associated transporter protein [Eumeta japonica]